MDKLFDRIEFKNDSAPALNEDNLNLISKAIDDIDNRVIDIYVTVEESLEEARDGIVSDISGIVTNANDMAQIASTKATEAIVASQTADEKATEASRKAEEAKADAERAKLYADNVEAVSGVDIATKDKAGLLKGGENTIAEDGTLLLTRTTTDRTLTESHAGGLKINRMDGESQQKQYSGKNLLNNTKTTITKTGVTFTVNADKSITVNGTATADTYLGSILFTPVVGQTYMGSGCRYKDSGSFHAFYTNINGSPDWTSSNVEFTASTSDIIRYDIYVKKGHTVNNETVYPMIRLASVTDATYEPYVGGVASPNPDYPQDIKSVEVSEIKGVGKNLLKNIATTKTVNGVTFTVNNDGSVTIKGTATATANFTIDNIKSPKLNVGKYVFAYDYSNLNIVTFVDVFKNNAWKKIIGNNGTPFSITETELEKGYQFNFMIRVPSGTAINNVTVYPMLRRAEDNDTYEPYTEKSIQLSAPIILHGIGDAKDVLCERDGVYGVLRNFGRIILDGTENWLKNDTLATTDYLYLTYDKSKWNMGAKSINAFCSHFQVNTNVSIVPPQTKITPHFADIPGPLYLGAKNIGLVKNDITTLKAWLSSNNVTVDYQLATPTFEPLPIADQIALHQLETFDTVTYISTDSEIEPIMEVEYGTSKVGAYTIKGMNTADANALKIEQLNTLTNELATQLVAGSEV